MNKSTPNVQTYKRKHVSTFSTLLILFLILSCDDNIFREGDFFYLVNKQAEMPVIVRGNKASGVFIVFLHGGPGGTAFQKIGLPAFNALEKSYAMVFWDQRASGSSQGNSPNHLLTLNQFVEDLSKLIDLLKFKYQDPTIFLLGHSWGGCLGTAYLTDKNKQNKIRGWIEMDGAHNNPLADSLSLQWITTYAKTQIAKNSEVEFWKYALNWYDKNPNFTSDQLEHYAFLGKANGYVHDPAIKRDPATYPAYSLDYVFGSPADVTATLTNYNHVIKNFIISDIDLTPQMKAITIPSLILWGEHDGVIPYPLAINAFQALGTPATQKSIITFHNSAHAGFYEEHEVFVGAVAGFIELYR